jgi:UMF1 family MFS transporter
MSTDAPPRSSTFGWVVFDLANTIFALGVIGLYFPDWLTNRGLPDSALASTQAIAGVIVIFAAPWVGARSDHLGKRMPALVGTTLAAVAATSLLTRGPDLVTFALLGVALVSVNIGSVVYDALLPEVSTESNRGWVSGLGVGVGYVGSFVGLGIGIVTLDVLSWSPAANFTTLAVAFLIFALPTFLLVHEHPVPARPGRPPGFGRIVSGLLDSWVRARHHPHVIRFLISRFLYTDAINTLIGGFLTIFALQELGLDRQGSQTLLGIAIAAAIVGGLAGGALVERLGPKRVLQMTLSLWIAAILLGVLAAVTGATDLAWVLGAAGGIALGGTWASDRVVMVRVSPAEHLGEFYGLYATVGRFATILGPLAWALVVDVLGWGRRAAMVLLAVFIAAGLVVLRNVDDRPANSFSDA